MRRRIGFTVLFWKRRSTWQEQCKEDIKAVAENMGVKPARLNKIIGMVEKERATGEVVGEERETLDVVEALTSGDEEEE